MKFQLQRYAIRPPEREGKDRRENDNASFVEWDVTATSSSDEKNKKIIIKTESHVYVKDLK